MSKEARMNWLWFIGAWVAIGAGLGLLIGRSIHLANVKAGGGGPEDPGPGAVVPPPPPAPAIERHIPPAAPVRRQTPTSSARSPFIGGCVSPSERAPSEHEHGVI
jgi:hypothetical protein